MSRTGRPGGTPFRLWAMLLLGALTPPSSESRTWVVHPDGSGDAPTLQAASDSSAVGDTLLATSGEHLGSVQLGEGRVLRGESGSGGVSLRREDPGMVAGVYGSRIEGLTLIGAYPGYGQTGEPILFVGGTATVESCRFTGFPFQIQGSEGELRIIGCEFDAGEIHFYTGAASTVEVSGCTFESGVSYVASTVFAFVGAPMELTVTDCSFRGCGGDSGLPVVGWEVYGSLVANVSNNLFLECVAPAAGYSAITIVDRAALRGPGAAGGELASLAIVGNTIARSVRTGLGSTFSGFEGATIHRNAITGCNGGLNLSDADGATVTCNNVWGNGADWIGGPDLTGVEGNLSAPPFYCAAEAGNLTLAQNSPMLPDNNTCAVQIGAFGQGCGPASVEPRSWARIKGFYRQ